jgi:hypothetical protein
MPEVPMVTMMNMVVVVSVVPANRDLRAQAQSYKRDGRAKLVRQ